MDLDGIPNRYNVTEVYNRFLALSSQKTTDDLDEDGGAGEQQETDQQKTARLGHGVELWGIGYVSTSDHSEDEDSEEDDEEAD